ncbi:unnamed protein product [Prorocentrum cordatum]|uniref:Uncharacterized protein n=1 Tax=Prorocentrum cordatum TaxID=2364126 RepID=A0ABN9V0L3_9DINO|nr:unnamed protein product [Polarella glacialis]
MPREREGFLLSGDWAAVAYLRHAAAGRGASSSRPPEGAAFHDLDECHLLCQGGAALERWLEDRIDAFVSQNILEAPEDAVTFSQGAEAPRARARAPAAREAPAAPPAPGAAGAPRPAKGRGRGVKRAAPEAAPQAAFAFSARAAQARDAIDLE